MSWLRGCQGDVAWLGLKVTTASGCLHIKSQKRVELFAGRQSKADREGWGSKADRQHAGKNRFPFCHCCLVACNMKIFR